MKRILVVADCSDVALNELHATLVTNLDRLGSQDVAVEPAVKIEPFSIINASFLSRLMAENYDPKSLYILGVVNPLNPSGRKRARLAIRLKNGIHLVQPNTGMFSWLIKDFGIDEIVETNRDGLRGKEFIPFGGKYIHAPVMAKLAASGDIGSVSIAKFDSKQLVTIKHPVGQIVHIDNFGVSKIMMKSVNAKEGDILHMSVNGESHGIITYTTSMKELKDGRLALYPGSSMGLHEVGLVRKLNTAEKIHLKIGDVITFQKTINLNSGLVD